MVRAQRSGGSRRSAAAAIPRLPLGSRAGSLRLVEEGRVHVDSRADWLKGARLSPWVRTARSFRVARTCPIRFVRGFWVGFGWAFRADTPRLDKSGPLLTQQRTAATEIATWAQSAQQQLLHLCAASPYLLTTYFARSLALTLTLTHPPTPPHPHPPSPSSGFLVLFAARSGVASGRQVTGHPDRVSK